MVDAPVAVKYVSTDQVMIARSVASDPVGVLDKQIQIGGTDVAIYFSHLPFVSYKTLRLCRKYLMLLEYYKFFATLPLYQRI
jgi:hypothetical protein